MGSRRARVADLAANAYEAALHPALWPDVVRDVRTAFGAMSANITLFDLLRSQGTSLNDGGDPAATRDYLSHYARIDPVVPALKHALPSRRPIHRAALVPDAELVRTEFYGDWLRPQGISHSLLAATGCDDGLTAVIVLDRGPRQHDFGSDIETALEMLLPHLGRALRTSHRLAAAEMRGRGSEAALACLRDGALLLDPNGVVLYANAAGEALLREGDGVATARGRLCARRPADDAALRRILAEATAGNGGTVAVSRPPGRAALAVSVEPAWRGRLAMCDPWMIVPRPAALVFIVDPERDAPVGVAALRSLFGLTAMEAAVLETIALGCGVGEAAAKLRIRPSTLRSHLKQVFHKTGTSRQAQLARLCERLGVLATEPAPRDRHRG